MSRAPKAYSHYQQSSLGISLREALQDMVDADEISEENAVRMLTLFDQSVNKHIEDVAEDTAMFKGHLHTYRNCDNVWTFILENVKITVENEVTRVGRVKVVACDGTEKAK